ncbi:MAG: ABC transporter ATP-binding protein [Candidatus Cloacimonetes bacterium]|nr:ABC transporter ATP-binding protein [Candidatus Cloacimonadota bacterium]
MKNIKRIYKIMLRYWGYLLAGLFFMLGYAVFSGVSIVMAIPLLDHVFKPEKVTIIYTNFPSFWIAIQKIIAHFISQHGSLFALSQKQNYEPFLEELKTVFLHTDPIFLLWLISVTLILLVLLKNIFFYCNKIMFTNLRGKTIRTIRNQMFKKYLYQSLAFFNINKVGDSLVRMVSDVKIVSDFFIKAIFDALQNIILILIFARVALFLNAKLFLISLILLPIFSIIINYIGKKIKKYSKRIQIQSSNLFSNVEEILNSMRIVKAFSREDHELGKFKDINQKHFKFWRKSRVYHLFNVPLSELHGTITGVVILLIGGNQVLSGSGNFTLGSFIAFLLAIFSMLHPMKIITQAYAEIRKALVSLDRISVILDRRSEIEEAQDAVQKDTFESKIEFKNVSFSYDRSPEVLKNIALIINKGERVAIVGGSGSGKTTLVNLLERMYDTESGEIFIDEIEIRKIKLKDLRTLFGTVTQESILFGDTIANNISYGTLEEVSAKEIINAAEVAYADEFIDKLPHKYNEMLYTKGSNLSGGQKQRLCIARAIVGDPPILIFDEATSALDTEAEQKVQKAIEQATKNRTVIVIAHRLSTILSSDKIVVLDKSKIVGIGKHKELLKTCERYQTLYDLQFADNA